MPQVNIFRWHSGRGWLVLSGGGASEAEAVVTIEANTLSHTFSSGPIAYVWAASDIETADRHMDDLRELGARTGYLLDILSEDDDTVYRQLSEAGLIILGDGPQREVLREALAGPALRGMEEAFQRGATIYAPGTSAAILGTYVIHDSELLPGYNWLSSSIIQPHFTQQQADMLRGWIQEFPGGYGLGLADGAALALGPRGEVEVWGNPSITVSLGGAYDSDADGNAGAE